MVVAKEGRMKLILSSMMRSLIVHHRFNIECPSFAPSRLRGTIAILFLATASIVFAAPPSRDLAVLLIIGAPGTPEYEARFTSDADIWSQTCIRAGVACDTLGAEDLPEGKDHIAPLRQWLDTFIKTRKEDLWVVLIGHGTFDGREAKFNLRGPDLLLNDLTTWLKPMTRNLAVINTSSAGAPVLKTLAGENRCVITAVKSVEEISAPRFGAFFAKAIAGQAEADQDGDGQVSLLEAFLRASRQVTQFYEQEDRLATEHAMLEDNGDGLAVRADEFTGMHPNAKPPAGKTLPDGMRARQWHLVLNAQEAALSDDLRNRRDALERDAAAIRQQKDKLAPDEYYQELEAIFLELAKLYRQST